jgi:hypothetical protein
MKLTQHSEYTGVYLRNQAAFQHCQQAVADWKASNKTIAVPAYGLHWSYETARLFVQELSRLFQAYNQVLWENFHYCRQCGGQCCVVDASNVQAFDHLAIALLDRAAPALPDNITARDHQCIYLLNRRCSWPEEWRTIKCWSFYCLGVGPWQPGSSVGELRGAIIVQLRQVVCAHLPAQLQQYEAISGISLTDPLDDPVHFSEILHQALAEIFVKPFEMLYALDELDLMSSDGESDDAEEEELSLESLWVL